MKYYPSIGLLFILFLWSPAFTLERPDKTFKIFQFPAQMIPRIDGDASDWDCVPDAYKIRTDQLVDDEGHHEKPNPESLDICVRVGWVRGFTRLYFLYEAFDDYWDFSLPDLHNDTFELVVDGDASGGPLIDWEHHKIWTSQEVGISRAADDKRIRLSDANWAIHGVHAQNYHIFTPAEGKVWTLVWGVQPWIKELPFANAVCDYHFKPGESGKLVLEFWITPFDYAGPEGPCRAVQSVLEENKIIGLSFAVLDYDDVLGSQKDGFWNLSREHKMYGNASYLCAFQLMPFEPGFNQSIRADWSFRVIDMNCRSVAFQDHSIGKITSWEWDFGDGTTSKEQHPIHIYQKAGTYTVILNVKGPGGSSRLSKVWEITVK
ncbi:PKD domain-containing protein [bacterium]|nr:PKD domain-containing protein [bacterium]